MIQRDVTSQTTHIVVGRIEKSGRARRTNKYLDGILFNKPVVYGDCKQSFNFRIPDLTLQGIADSMSAEKWLPIDGFEADCDLTPLSIGAPKRSCQLAARSPNNRHFLFEGLRFCTSFYDPLAKPRIADIHRMVIVGGGHLIDYDQVLKNADNCASNVLFIVANLEHKSHFDSKWHVVDAETFLNAISEYSLASLGMKTV